MPTITEIVEGSSKKTLVFHTDIPTRYVEAIKAVYGREPHKISDSLEKAAKAYFGAIRKESKWLGCDCRRHANLTPTLTTVDGGLIRRVETSGHAPHAETCAFYRSASDQSYHRSSYRRGRVNYKIRSNFREARTAQRIELMSKRNKRKPANSLQRIMWELLSQSGRNQIFHPAEMQAEQRTRQGEIASISAFAGTQFIRNPAIPLADVLSFDIFGLPKFSLALRKRNWASGDRPQGFLLGTVTNFGRGFASVEKKSGEELRRLNVHGRLSVFGEHQGSTVFARKPYLALFSVAQISKDASWVDAVAAYLHPVLDHDNWVPVDSDAERMTLRCLKTVQERLATEGIETRVTKPLFDMNPSTNSHAPVLIPDFTLYAKNVITGKDANLLIETMGFDADWYREDKARVHESMEQLGRGTVVPYNVYERPTGHGWQEFDESFICTLIQNVIDLL
jgi:hypothetical protein